MAPEAVPALVSCRHHVCMSRVVPVGGRKGDGDGETGLSQSCAKIFSNLHIISCKMENFPTPVSIRKLRAGSILLDIKQPQIPELYSGSTRIRATDLAGGPTPAPSVCGEGPVMGGWTGMSNEVFPPLMSGASLDSAAESLCPGLSYCPSSVGAFAGTVPISWI